MPVDEVVMQSDEQVNRYEWLKFLEPRDGRALARIVLCGLNQTWQINVDRQHLTSSNTNTQTYIRLLVNKPI